MHARLPFERGPCTGPTNLGHCLAHAAECRLAQPVNFNFPAASFGVAQVRTEELTGEDSRFVTPRPRTNLNEHILPVVRIRIKEECGESLNNVALNLLCGGALCSGEEAHLGVRARVKLHPLCIRLTCTCI
jgi:hypothetical protein